MAILSLNNIVKNYGRIRALNGVSFDVPKACVFGILGPNGSGKTTLLGIIMNILFPDSGSFEWFDAPATDEQRKLIGTLLETPNFYHYLSGEQNLKISAEIKGRGHDEIDHVLDMVSLKQRKNSAFSTYSLGMKQRLAIAAALLGNPEVLVLDEPTNGLDPVGIAEIRTLIQELARKGKTIIMASHLLDEVEKVCTHVAILKKGDLVITGSVDEIFATDDLVEVAANDIYRLDNALNGMQGYKSKKINGEKLELIYETGSVNLEQLNRYCFEQGITLTLLNQRKRSLENKFLQLTNPSA